MKFTGIIAQNQVDKGRNLKCIKRHCINQDQASQVWWKRNFFFEKVVSGVRCINRCTGLLKHNQYIVELHYFHSPSLTSLTSFPSNDLLTSYIVLEKFGHDLLYFFDRESKIRNTILEELICALNALHSAGKWLHVCAVVLWWSFVGGCVC